MIRRSPDGGRRSCSTRPARPSSARPIRARTVRQCRSQFGSRYNEESMRVVFPLLFLAACACAQTLPANWRIQPAGTQLALASLPTSAAVSPDGTFLLSLNAGARPSISVVDVAATKETARVAIPDAGLGLAFSPDGRRVYAGGGSRNAVLEFTFPPVGELRASREISAGP